VVEDERAALRRVLSLWRDRRWRDVDRAANLIVSAIVANGGRFSPELGEVVPDSFLVTHSVDKEHVTSALATAFKDVVIIADSPALISIDEIETFAVAGGVNAQDLKGLAMPMAMPEERLKELISGVIGEPFVAKDWGGERDDIFTTRVRMRGRRIITSFALKGAGTPDPLTPRKMGKNGDQIQRMLTQPAELFVIAHAGRIAPTIFEQLELGIRALRHANALVVGSVWDGIDCARLLVGAGLMTRDGTVVSKKLRGGNSGAGEEDRA
jgi:hypothetical protein